MQLSNVLVIYTSWSSPRVATFEFNVTVFGVIILACPNSIIRSAEKLMCTSTFSAITDLANDFFQVQYEYAHLLSFSCSFSSYVNFWCWYISNFLSAVNYQLYTDHTWANSTKFNFTTWCNNAASSVDKTLLVHSNLAYWLNYKIFKLMNLIKLGFLPIHFNNSLYATSFYDLSIYS